MRLFEPESSCGSAGLYDPMDPMGEIEKSRHGIAAGDYWGTKRPSI